MGRNGGQITVFLSIVLFAVIMLAGVLIDAARVLTAQTQLERALASSTRSALANYSARLKSDYGVFALSTSDETALKGIIGRYMEKNLSVDKEPAQKGIVDLYGFRVEGIKVAPIFNLSENEVVKNQILEYMKYRAPVRLLEGIWDRLAVVSEAGRMSEAYGRKIAMDRKASKVARLQERLKKDIDGEENGKNAFRSCINLFNSGNARQLMVSSFAEYVGRYETLSEELHDITKKISDLPGNPDGGTTGEIESLRNEESRVLLAMAQVKAQMDGLIGQIENLQTRNFLTSNEDAVSSLKEILLKTRDFRQLSADLKNYLTSNFPEDGQDDISKGFRQEMRDDVGSLERQIPDEAEAERYIGIIDGNIACLKGALMKIEEVKALVDGIGAGNARSQKATPAYIAGLLNEGLESYGRLAYDYKRAGNAGANPGDKGDPRRDKEEEARESLKDTDTGDRNLEKEGISISGLPSHTKLESRVFPEEDGYGADSASKQPDGEDTAAHTAFSGYASDPSGIGEEVEFGEQGGFSEKAFGFAGILGSIMDKGFPAMRDELYIDEYILGTFKSAVPALKKENGMEEDLDMGGTEKKKRKSFFDCEVEYILHGNPSQNVNKLMTRGQVLLFRFAMDTLHAYMDPQKKELAYSVAACVSGWWTCGLAIPLVSNLVLCGWGMGEAVIDLKHLAEGESVPFYKLRGDWELDLGLGKAPGPKSDKRLLFNYYDYLRLFLLLKSADEKINRIEDLIEMNVGQENSGFKAAGANTRLRVEAEVSIRYFFINRFFTPGSLKTGDGRHKLKAVVYDGY